MMNRSSLCDTLKDDHIFRLTDDTGMLQHSKYSVPDPVHGYTTDDNARALIMALMLYEKYRKKEYLDLVYRFSSFLLNAQNEKGRFKNFMGYDRKWLEDEGSEDCFGRCIWALGFAISNKYTPQRVKHALMHILEKALPNVPSIYSLRGKAYSMIGLSCLDGFDVRSLVFDMAQALCGRYYENRDGDWKWFENIVTYSNSTLPWSLFAAYRVTGERKFLDVAEESLEFLESVTFKDGYFKPVGCKGWLLKGGSASDYDEQPVEACETALAYLEAYSVAGKEEYKQKAQKCHAWYEGLNSKCMRLVDDETGGCYDGLTEKGVNFNQGAESLISYYISCMAFFNEK